MTTPISPSALYLVPHGESTDEGQMVTEMLHHTFQRSSAARLKLLKELLPLILSVAVEVVVDDVAEYEAMSFAEVGWAEDYLAYRLLPRYQRRLRHLLKPRLSPGVAVTSRRQEQAMTYWYTLTSIAYNDLVYALQRERAHWQQLAAPPTSLSPPPMRPPSPSDLA